MRFAVMVTSREGLVFTGNAWWHKLIRHVWCCEETRGEAEKIAARLPGADVRELRDDEPNPYTVTAGP